MKAITVLACAWLVAAGACASELSGDVRVTSPELVAVSPSIQVVADADEPLFYADGFYWLYRDHTWYRSDQDRSGFARIDPNMIPGDLRSIQQPQVYAHYRRNQGRIYARGPQMQQREQPRPQGTQPQQQRPTEPLPSSPEQKPPVPNPMPQSNPRGEDHTLPMNGEHDHGPPSQPQKTSPDKKPYND
jgi:hypothetical protein